MGSTLPRLTGLLFPSGIDEASLRQQNSYSSWVGAFHFILGFYGFTVLAITVDRVLCYDIVHFLRHML